jgi:hypothetical protein
MSGKEFDRRVTKLDGPNTFSVLQIGAAIMTIPFVVLFEGWRGMVPWLHPNWRSPPEPAPARRARDARSLRARPAAHRASSSEGAPALTRASRHSAAVGKLDHAGALITPNYLFTQLFVRSPPLSSQRFDIPRGR